MPWLFIDTTKMGSCRFGLLHSSGKGITTKAVRAGRLLPLIARSIGLRVLKQQVEGICVVAGPGSFSAVRSGVLLANLLARFLSKPLLGVSVEQARDLASLFTEVQQSGLRRAVAFVEPVYDAEPNITQPVRV